MEVQLTSSKTPIYNNIFQIVWLKDSVNNTYTLISTEESDSESQGRILECGTLTVNRSDSYTAHLEKTSPKSYWCHFIPF